MSVNFRMKDQITLLQMQVELSQGIKSSPIYGKADLDQWRPKIQKLANLGLTGTIEIQIP